jgi:hypothetical protein
MSEAEQDAIIGRTVREYHQAKKALAALVAEAEHFGEYLTAVGHALRTHHSLSSGTYGSYGDKLDADKFPTAARLSELVSQIEQATATKKRLSETLRSAGYEFRD